MEQKRAQRRNHVLWWIPFDKHPNKDEQIIFTTLEEFVNIIKYLTNYKPAGYDVILNFFYWYIKSSTSFFLQNFKGNMSGWKKLETYLQGNSVFYKTVFQQVLLVSNLLYVCKISISLPLSVLQG